MNLSNNEIFFSALIGEYEKKASECNMSPEQKKDYITKKLFEYYERNYKKTSLKYTDIASICKEACPEFDKEGFFKYLIHTLLTLL